MDGIPQALSAREGTDTGPAARPRSPRRAALVVAVALVAGALGFLLAPTGWPEGSGRFELRVAADRLVNKEIQVGTRARMVLGSPDGAIEVVLPEGVPVDAPVRAEIDLGEVTTRGPSRTAVDAVLVLPDGREELLPVTRVEDDGRLLAARVPPQDARVVATLLGVVVVLWVSELLPLFATSMAIPVVLVAGTGTAPADALAPFFHPIIALFFAGFLMAEAMRRAGLDRRVALTLVARAAHTPVWLFGALLGVAAFLSMWMSNTATVALLIPIALAVTAPIGHREYQRVVVLGIAYAATIGGVGSLIGTPANPIAVEFLAELVGERVTFAEWFLVGLPMVVLFLPLMGAYLWWRGGVRVDAEAFGDARRAARSELDALGDPQREEVVVLAVFVLVAAMWLTQTWHGLDTGIVALGGAVLLVALGRIRRDDLGRISWASLLTFGGGLALGFALTNSGTSDWIATRLGVLEGVPEWLAVAVVAVVALVTTTVASNTATAATFVPLAIPLAGVLGVDPTLLVLTVAVASSVDFALVVGTPATLLAYSTGLFTPAEIFRTGAVLDLAGIALLVTLVTLTWNLLGIV